MTEVQEIAAHFHHDGYALIKLRVAILLTEPRRKIRFEIEAALRGLGGNPHADEIIERIALETARMDQHAEGSVAFKAHAETIQRSLTELGLYRMCVSHRAQLALAWVRIEDPKTSAPCIPDGQLQVGSR